MNIFSLVLKPFAFIERILIGIRDAFWNYPEAFSPDKGYNKKIIMLYVSSVPYSHFVLATLTFVLLFVTLFSGGLPHILGSSEGTLVEGVIMGVDESGNVQKINKINPILPSNIQLEKDLVNLIYEPLLKYNYVETDDGTSVGGVQTVLAEEIITISPGANYEIILRDNIEWHDSTVDQPHFLTSDDVIATFDLYASLDENTSSNIYSKTLKQLQWLKIDDNSFRICTVPTEEIQSEPCDSEDLTYPIFSNFLELISFKIIPEKYTEDLDAYNIDSSEPILFRQPVGTGLFELDNVSNSSITLSVNKKHGLYSDKMSMKFLKFEFFKDLEGAISALQNAEVHTLASSSIEYKERLAEYNQIETYVSDILYNQFWAMYFNLRLRPDGTSIAPEFLQDVNVRRAISSAINRSNIVNETLRETGAEAYSPIPNISYFFNNEAGWYRYDTEKSVELLEEAGWKLRDGNQFRTNEDGEELRFTMYYVDNFDRREVAKSIKTDLAAIGVNAVIDSGHSDSLSGWSLSEINDQYLSPGLFDVIIYGMQTFIDPDRYELYHSSQSRYPGLNIAGYVSSEQTVDKNEDREEGESSVIQVPKVDRFLDLARSFNPEDDREARQDRYFTIQDLIASDVPAVYLYHPQYLYFANKRVSRVDLTGASSLEDRFRNIYNWSLE